MKANTSDLYKLMSSVEKANLYMKTTDEVERKKIIGSVPRFYYSAIDYEFKNRIDRANFEQLTLLIDWFSTSVLLVEAHHDAIHASSDDKRLANLYLSKLAAIEEAIDQNHKAAIATMGHRIDVEGYCIVCELEVQPELVDRFRQQIKQTKEEVINEMSF